MKKMFLVLFFLFVACSDSDKGNDSEEQGFVKFNIDGVSYNYTVEAEGGFFPDPRSESFFQADAADENNSENDITFRISGDLAEKEYAVDKCLIWIEIDGVMYTALDFEDNDLKITITDLGKEGEMVSGTFSATLGNDSESDSGKTFKLSGSFSVFRNDDAPVVY